MDDRLRKMVLSRSRGRCEAMLSVNEQPAVRCPKPATEIHHLLTKARGGAILDKQYETYHLLHLCPECHAWSDGAKAYLEFLLIEGSMHIDKLTSKPYYEGSDPYLSKRYPLRGVRWVEPQSDLL